MLVLTGSNVGLAAWGHGGVGWGLKLIRVIRAVDWAICMRCETVMAGVASGPLCCLITPFCGRQGSRRV